MCNGSRRGQSTSTVQDGFKPHKPPSLIQARKSGERGSTLLSFRCLRKVINRLGQTTFALSRHVSRDIHCVHGWGIRGAVRPLPPSSSRREYKYKLKKDPPPSAPLTSGSPGWWKWNSGFFKGCQYVGGVDGWMRWIQ